MAEDDLEPAAGGEPARKGRYVARHRKAKSRRSGARRLLIGVNIVVALALITAALGTAYAEVQLHRINHIAVRGIVKPGHSRQSPSTPSGPPMTVLIVGSDSRAALKEPGDSQFGGSGDVGGARSDTIILARIVPATHSIELLSVPRDLYVDIPGMGMQKINAAIGSSPNLLIQVLHTQLGIDINHYVDVDFDSFRQIADAIGGVEVYFPTRAKDSMSGLNIPAPGCYNLEGDTALSYVRSRDYQYYEDGEWHQEAASDLARIQRQQAFIKRMVDKAQGKFDSPLAIDRIVSSVTKNLTVDSGFSNGLLISLAKTFHGVDSSAIPTATLDTSPETIDGADVLTLDHTQADQQIQAFNNIGNTPSSSGSTSTATTAPVSTKAPAHAPDPSSVSVEVVNGSGMSGQAAEATDAIKHYGYMATTISTSRAYVGAANVIHYSPDAKASAQLLASQMKGGAQLVSDASLQPTAFNLELITGSAYAGTNDQPATPATSSTTVAPTTSTTAPPAPGAATDTTYTLPGTPPGQKPPASCTP